MVLSLLEKDGLRAKHPLFARGERGLEKMGFRDEDEFGGPGA